MSEQDNSKASQGVHVIGELMRLAGDDDSVKRSAKNLGESALIVTSTVKNCLLPLAALNFGFEKARCYFSEKFQTDISKKTESISKDDIIEPKASIVGPALQGLAFSHDEDDLKELYLQLIASSMNKSMEKETHPAFVEIIKQLSADEVPILNLYIKHSLNAAIVNITSKSENGGVRTLYRNLLNLYKGDEVHVDSKISSYVDNWIRLGLVGVNYEKSLRGDDVYNSFIERPEFLQAQEEEENSGRVVSIQKGALYRTSFGAQFAKAVGINEEK
ncbi:Uncharacterised protein [Serratia marcescens]|uniref:DUF4393 domain-containing protein n=1 Tax=Serratia marcescens TaxID=615 RepID=UPI00217ADDC9|nr:DUF4393 domain-containing protein [Serratia marcescens]CAI1916817.1 Uncharacterised protein [Serratia marcescens]